MHFKRSAKFHILNLSKNLKVYEVMCPCGQCDIQKLNLGTVEKWQKMRDLTGMAIKITPNGGWFRCVQYNAMIQGRPTSAHIEGRGFDCYQVGKSGLDLARAGLEAGFRNIGVGRDWCHLDDGPTTGDLDVWSYDNIDVNWVRKVLEKDLKELEKKV